MQALLAVWEELLIKKGKKKKTLFICKTRRSNCSHFPLAKCKSWNSYRNFTVRQSKIFTYFTVLTDSKNHFACLVDEFTKLESSSFLYRKGEVFILVYGDYFLLEGSVRKVYFLKLQVYYSRGEDCTNWGIRKGKPESRSIFILTKMWNG